MSATELPVGNLPYRLELSRRPSKVRSIDSLHDGGPPDAFAILCRVDIGKLSSPGFILYALRGGE